MALDYKSSIARYRRYMQLVQEKPLIKASVYVIFSLVLMIVLLVWALRPTVVTIAGLAGEIKAKKELSERLSAKIIQLQQAGSLLAKDRDRLKMLDEVIPEEPQWKELASKLEEMATASGLTLVEVSVGPTQIQGTEAVNAAVGNAASEKSPLPEGISGISFSVSALGEYPQFKLLLEEMEKLRRVLILTETRIFRDEDGRLTVAVSGVAGYEKKENR